MAKTLTLLLSSVAALLLAAAASAAEITCKCRSNGEFFVLGEHTCIKTSEGFRLARCDMVLNNTSWVVVGNSCPLSALPPGSDPEGRLLASLQHLQESREVSR